MVHSETDQANRLRAVVGKLSRRLRPTLAGTGLTPTRMSVLFTVVRLGPMRLSELAAMEGLNPTMLSRVVAELASSGLVKRTPDPLDRRAARVEATVEGARLRERILGERSDVLSVQLAELSGDERQAIADALPVLEELVERLKDRRV